MRGRLITECFENTEKAVLVCFRIGPNLEKLVKYKLNAHFRQKSVLKLINTR
jgi:hypothetical protein